MSESACAIVDFPSWDTIVHSNSKDQYNGFTFKQNLAENLFVSIEIRNESAICINWEDCIRFSFCTKNGFPIATVQYKLCKQAYYTGLEQLLSWAKTFQTAFKDFAEKSTIDITKNKIS